MHFDLKQLSRVATAFLLAMIFVLPQSLLAEGAAHLVSPADLQRAAVQASSLRQHNVEQVRQFFSSEKAETALRSAHMNPEQVKNAVSTLDDAELAQLAQRTQKAQADFAAGTLSDRDLIIILVAVAVLILDVWPRGQGRASAARGLRHTASRGPSGRLAGCPFRKAGKRWLRSGQHCHGDAILAGAAGSVAKPRLRCDPDSAGTLLGQSPRHIRFRHGALLP